MLEKTCVVLFHEWFYNEVPDLARLRGAGVEKLRCCAARGAHQELKRDSFMAQGTISFCVCINQFQR
jgi:hypothetical protein